MSKLKRKKKYGLQIEIHGVECKKKKKDRKRKDDDRTY